MKLNDLIGQLMDLQSQHGDVEVLAVVPDFNPNNGEFKGEKLVEPNPIYDEHRKAVIV